MAEGERRARVERRTRETAISVELVLDGSGRASVATGIGFFDHMLEALARHGLFDLTVTVQGDLHVDGHHTVEDTGLVLGRALAQALGEKVGLRRFGWACVPMDEALVLAAVDLSGRPYLGWDVRLRGPMIGGFDVQLAQEFFRALAQGAGMNLHLRQLAGENDHHVVEAAFKAVARALDQATGLDPRVQGVPSTKGVLE